MITPKIIPPRSIVRVVKADISVPVYRAELGRQYRVGYYRRGDGLGTIWLVDEEGNYIGTTDKRHLAKYFSIESISSETDLFGDRRPQLSARRRARPIHFLPPLTMLRLQRSVSLRHLKLIADQVGQYFRVGYYTPNDGLETIWIVNEDGDYVGTIARSRLKKYFRVVSISKELNYCGTTAIDPLPEHQRLEAARMGKMLAKGRGVDRRSGSRKP